MRSESRPVRKTSAKSRIAADAAPAPAEHRETWIEQIASFVGFFIYLLILKTFFLPLFIIPTGSMAETLRGAHSAHTCPNCGTEYAVGQPDPQSVPRAQRKHPPQIRCPNCRWTESLSPSGRAARGVPGDDVLPRPLRTVAGDRIFVHGWYFDGPLAGLDGLKPQRWDIVVFKVPNDGQTNYIKRLIGKPGEEIELIDGDLYVNGQIAGKTAPAQRALWFPCYNHDYPPAKPARFHFLPGDPVRPRQYFPRWVASDNSDAWSEVHDTRITSRVVRFDGLDEPRRSIQFATDLDAPLRTGRVDDMYGYNPRMIPDNTVSDLRLSAEVRIEEGGGEGYVELSTTKYDERFIARLYADGRLTLEREHLRGRQAGSRELWGAARVSAPTAPLPIALSNVDHVVSVLVAGEPVITSTPEQYSITPDLARRQGKHRTPPEIRFSAERVRATLSHLLIERDIYYTNDRDRRSQRRPNASAGNALRLGPDEYFCCGDNSPNSLDGRYWYQDMVGPHLREKAESGAYAPGSVPADQMIGRAFFVYWPGFLPLTSSGPNLLPDLGHARWIR